MTPQAFWRNWHISLSTWLRDYLYIPLGGSRGGAWRTRRNLLITMVLGGLWHGAAWTFVLWGLYQGVLLVVYRPFEPRIQALRGGAAGALPGSIMFHLTCYGWLIFRRRLVRPSRRADARRCSRGSIRARSTSPACCCRWPATPRRCWSFTLYEAWADDLLAVPRLRLPLRYSVYLATLYVMLLFGNFGGSDFIYFQF